MAGHGCSTLCPALPACLPAVLPDNAKDDEELVEQLRELRGTLGAMAPRSLAAEPCHAPVLQRLLAARGLLGTKMFTWVDEHSEKDTDAQKMRRQEIAWAITQVRGTLQYRFVRSTDARVRAGPPCGADTWPLHGRTRLAPGAHAASRCCACGGHRSTCRGPFSAKP